MNLGTRATNGVATAGVSIGGAALRMPQGAWLLVLFVALAVPALTLPWYWPVRPGRSVSYMFGFSNTALWALLVVGVIAPAFALARSRLGLLLPGKLQGEAPTVGVENLKSWALAAYSVYAIFLLGCAYDMADMMEADYFLTRVALLGAGKMPYVDFEFAYGLLLLYAPLAVQKLGVPPSLSLVLVILLQSVIGYLALKAIADRVLPATAARFVFFGMMLATAPSLLMAGQNYTFFRFAAAPAVVCLLISRTSARDGWTTAVLTGPIAVITWLVSPEIGIAMACALMGVSFVLSGAKVRVLLVSGLSLAACVIATPLLTPSYRTMFEFGGGGNNLPAFPGPHILFAVLTIVLATLQVASRRLRDQPVGLFLYLFSVALIPGMFGRCDAVHVVFYGFGFTILAAKYCLEHRVKGLSLRSFTFAYAAIFIACWVAIHTHFTWYRYIVGVTRTVVATETWLEPMVGRYPDGLRQLANLFRQTGSWEPDPELIRSGKLHVLPPRYDMPAIEHVSLYWVGLENAFSAGSFDAITRELAGKRVLVWTAMFALCKPATADNSFLFLFPTSLFKARNDAHEVTRGFCAQLQEAPAVAWHGSFVELEIPK